MYSAISIEHEQSSVNGFLVDKNNPKFINYLVSILGEKSAQQLHKKIEQNFLTVLESHQMMNENLLEELLEYSSVFSSQKVLVSCNPSHTKEWLALGFKILEQNEQVLLEWG